MTDPDEKQTEEESVPSPDWSAVAGGAWKAAPGPAYDYEYLKEAKPTTPAADIDRETDTPETLSQSFPEGDLT